MLWRGVYTQLIGGYWLDPRFELVRVVGGDVAVEVVRKAAFFVHWAGRVGRRYGKALMAIAMTVAGR